MRACPAHTTERRQVSCEAHNNRRRGRTGGRTTGVRARNGQLAYRHESPDLVISLQSPLYQQHSTTTDHTPASFTCISVEVIIIITMMCSVNTLLVDHRASVCPVHSSARRPAVGEPLRMHFSRSRSFVVHCHRRVHDPAAQPSPSPPLPPPHAPRPLLLSAAVEFTNAFRRCSSRKEGRAGTAAPTSLSALVIIKPQPGRLCRVGERTHKRKKRKKRSLRCLPLGLVVC